MPAPPISVIVPVWNVAGHVAACLRSLAAQRLGDFEAIVVDDGSTDGSLAQARDAVAGDARFSFLEQPHRGLSAARNAGLTQARGAFIAFLDSDDRVAPDWLAALLAALEASGADWAASAIRFCGPGGQGRVHPAIHGPPPARMRAGMQPGMRPGMQAGQGAPVAFPLPDWPAVIRHYPSAWNKLYRRSLIGDVRFDEGSLYEDHAFFWQLSLRTDRLLWLPQPLYLQTQGRAGQITADGGEAVFAQIAVLDRLAGIAAGADRPGAAEALARIATRLGFERARRIAEPDRAARFAEACRDWFARQGLAPDPAWAAEERDDAEGHGWLAALAGGGGSGAGGRGWTQPGKSPITAPMTAPMTAGGAAPDAQPRSLAGTETEMLSFHVQDGAALSYEVDFRRVGYANISFFDAERSAILFHLSLRQAEWLAVCNRRLTESWEGERQHPVMLEETGDRVEIRFVDAATVEVRLNDELLCRHEGSFDRLDRIAGFDFQGGILAASLGIGTAPREAVPGAAAAAAAEPRPEMAAQTAPPAHSPAPPPASDLASTPVPAPVPAPALAPALAPAPVRGLGALRLELPMRLEGWVLDPRAAAEPELPALRLRLADGQELPVPALQPLPEEAGLPGTARLGFAVSLPGRVWHAPAAAGTAAAGTAAGTAAAAAESAGARRRKAARKAPAAAAPLAEMARPDASPPDGPPLEVQVLLDGQPCGLPLLVRRAEIRAQIEALASRPAPETDTPAILRAIEHVRFGGFWPALSEAARDGLARAARHYGVTDFLFPAQAEGAETAAPAAPALAEPADPGAFLLARLRDRFAETLRSEPDRDPAALLAELLKDPVPPAVRRQLFLELTEVFCSRDAFPALFALAGRDRQLRFEATGPADAWNSALLPFLCLEGRFEELRAVFWTLSKGAQGWLCTPALAWVVRELLRPGGPRPEEAVRDDILYAFMAVVEAERRDPAGRAPCVALIRATLALLAEMPRLVAYLRRDVEGFALRCYGLSRAFWAGVEAAEAAGGLALSPRLAPRLAAGRAAFAALAAAVEAGPGRSPAEAEAAAAALRLFAGCGAAEVGRWRLELFGPAGLAGTGLPGTGLPGTAALMAEGIDPGEAALRSLAAPGAESGAESGAGNQAALAREAVAARHTGLPQAPLATLQERAGRQALALLTAAPEAGGEGAGAALDALLADIALLAGGRSEFHGLGLGLRLLHGLIRLGRLEAADRVFLQLGWLVAALPAAEAARLAEAPAVASALWGLMRCRAGGASGADLAATLAANACALFPETLARVAALAGTAPEEPLPLPGRGPAAPLFDALVVVLSCRPYLDRRLPPMEAGWLGRLDALGIPWVVAVGDGGAESRAAPGGGRLIGRVLHLDAPDDYEGLPQKTLALLRWVAACTDVAHVLKIDDDCFLDAETFFCAQSHTKFDYYGRRIDRKPGDMDRAWHIAKSASARGRFELDKSPEPASYCDGGAGYVLSRRAMAALLAEAASPAAQELIAASFMEDKLVGDLLARAGVAPAEEDYLTCVLRRTHGAAIPVPLWANSFLPSRASGTRMAHLDSPDLQATAMAVLDSDRLHPPRIWPTTQPVRLGLNSNALTLVGEGARLDRAAAAPVAVVACVRNEMFMLPHFLAHYRRMGVEGFLIADNCSDDGTLEYLAGQPDVALFSVDTDYNASSYGVAWQQALLAHYRPGRWTVVADADELLFADAGRRMRLPDLLAGPDFAGAEAARIFMLDMYPKGPLAEADFASGDPFAEADHVERAPFRINWPGLGPFSDAPTWTSALRHRLFPGARPSIFVAQKIALLRYMPWMRLSAGLHYVADARLAGRELFFGHFKYNAAFAARARAEVARGQHFNDAEEYRKYLALVAEGRERLHEPGVSVPWQDCAFVRDRLIPPPRRSGRTRAS